MSFKESNTTESLNTNAHTVIIFKNAGSQVLNSLENSIELLLWFLILYFCYEMFFCCCSVTKFSLTLCDPMNCSMPAFHILHYHPEPAQTHVHWISDAIQPSHPLLSPSPPTFNLSQHQDIFQWVGSVLHIRWPKYWSLSFSISPSNEYSGLISCNWLIWCCSPRDSQEYDRASWELLMTRKMLLKWQSKKRYSKHTFVPKHVSCCFLKDK